MIVVDASVVVKVLTEERGSDSAIERLRAEPRRAAPDWMQVEVAAALSKKVRYAGLPVKQASEALAALPAMMPHLVPTLPIVSSAMTLSITLKHALYDCLYLALAVREGCNVLTADAKFADAASRSTYANHVELLA